MAKNTLFTLCLFSVLSTSAFAQSEDQSLTQLTVYGSNFSFSVNEPSGWTGNITKAKKFHANIIFYKKNEGLDNSKALIQILVFKKVDEQTVKDLNYDVSNYEKKFKHLQKQNIEFSHPEYDTYSAHIFVKNKFHQYICYVNPGPEFEKGLSIAMNVQTRDATELERKAFQTIISSLKLLK